ncbi:TPA: hypothetical protein ACG3P3_002381 [Clostridioides difficile]|nr:hypothetical protein [Clostridioides difficile]
MLEDVTVTITLKDLDKLREDNEELWSLKREIGQLMNAEVYCDTCTGEGCKNCKTKIKVEIKETEIKKLLFRYIYYCNNKKRNWIANECEVEEVKFYYIED